MWASSDLTLGKVSSCGCSQYADKVVKHGQSGSKTWICWRDMLSRCNDPKNRSFKNYGGRGIKVCPEWHSFAAFRKSMGDVKPGMTIERKRVDGDYEPSNCEWVARAMQSKNTRRSVIVTFSGATMCLKDACAAAGVSYEIAKKSSLARSNFDAFASS